MAGPGMRCWRRCAPTGPGCWPGPGSRRRLRPRWPGGRWWWPSRPRRGCRPSRGSWPRSGGWTLRTPRWPRCWPGAWTMMRMSRCGWRSRWRRGGSCGVGWRVSTRCCARPPGTPCRAVLARPLGGVSGDAAASLGHFTALRDAAAEREPSRVLADGLALRAATLSQMGRYADAAIDARSAVAVARELRYPAAEAVALANLSEAALGTGDQDRAVRLARQAAQITDGVPGWRARWVSYVL